VLQFTFITVSPLSRGACVIDDGSDADCSPECLAAVRLLLLAADAAAADDDDDATSNNVSSLMASGSSAGVTKACGALRQSLLPLADVLQSAGTHVYLSSAKLHRAMMMMTALTNQLNTGQGYYY